MLQHVTGCSMRRKLLQNILPDILHLFHFFVKSAGLVISHVTHSWHTHLMASGACGLPISVSWEVSYECCSKPLIILLFIERWQAGIEAHSQLLLPSAVQLASDWSAVGRFGYLDTLWDVYQTSGTWRRPATSCIPKTLVILLSIYPAHPVFRCRMCA